MRIGREHREAGWSTGMKQCNYILSKIVKLAAITCPAKLTVCEHQSAVHSRLWVQRLVKPQSQGSLNRNVPHSSQFSDDNLTLITLHWGSRGTVLISAISFISIPHKHRPLLIWSGVGRPLTQRLKCHSDGNCSSFQPKSSRLKCCELKCLLPLSYPSCPSCCLAHR